MKTKSAAKTSSNKNGKLASLKGVAKALFSSPAKTAAKGKKAAAPAPAKAAKNGKAAPVAAKGAKAAPAKAASEKSALKKAESAAPKAAAGKAAAPAKGAKAAAPTPAPAPVKGGKVAKGAKGGTGLGRTPRAIEEMCREVACESLSTSGGYCRMHYIKNWKKIKRKELILKEGKLNQYIEELVSKYPDKYIEAIREDLAEDKAFAKVIYDLELDESVDEFDAEGEGLEQVIDTIKRDFDDEGETF